MALSRDKLLDYQKRIMLSRLRILMDHGFYGLLLMHMILTIDEECQTAATDGNRIYFGPKFLDDLSESEIDFVMMHEILHVALRHCLRGQDKDNQVFNIACDIVVNSNILKSNNMDLNTITLEKYGESMHKTPSNEEGYLYTAEEVYEMLLNDPRYQGLKGTKGSKQSSSNSSGQKNNQGIDKANTNGWDDHTMWAEENGDITNGEIWVQRVSNAAAAIEREKAMMGHGDVPEIIARMLKELKKPQLDWRVILDDFIQEEVCDYSFSPPDRRFEDSGFFLPDFNDTDIEVADILFMIDTSGSMSDEMVVAAYSEVKGAIDQFDGKLQGWLGFFDAAIVEPIPFANVEDLLKIKPYGGGGTNFKIIFDYVNKYMQDNPPKSIIILTDGDALYPKESLANGIPVLWLLNNDGIEPPWGKIARIKIK